MLSFVKNRKAQNVDDFETWIETDVAPTLNVFDNGGDVRATVLVAYSLREDANANTFSATEIETARSLSALRPSVQSHHAQTFIAGDLSVRRLTPKECERLQGFPDDWTASQSDSQRFKQMGNAVTVNVIEWIGKRIMEQDNG